MGQILCKSIIDAFFVYFGETVKEEIISPQALPDFPGFSDIFAKQSSWKWNFGQASAFSHTLEMWSGWGGVELYIDVEHGVISRCQIFTDSLEPAPFELLANLTKELQQFHD
ncbi:hypothetical protein HZS38_08445 [Xenorhabdus nematophila]|nr:hypothetical protein D3790_08280 [Xenorhabdus nematophila]MBA0019172.1 hypothetical protein [Xenorhabdus nematophila]MCB4425682.1 hypothetical protein [Xenorhabdus nematophila]QNJ38347.1 hypothetical protein H8F46_08130 [Xenorhabdus nematophila]